MRAIVSKLQQQANGLAERGVCWLCMSRGRLICGCCAVCFADLPRLPPINLKPALAADHSRVWIAALKYEAPVDRWLHAFKFAQTPALAKPFAVLLSAQVVSYYKQEKRLLPEALVTVPMSAARWRQRGYNQAALLAKAVAKTLGLPLLDVVQRRNDHATQHTLDKGARLANMERAFEVPTALHQRRLAVVDDIITTGATVNGVAAVLAGQGVAEVDAWAMAYTPAKE
ncbi:ComF family protein [Aliidiomarina sp. Khilg15.8]